MSGAGMVTPGIVALALMLAGCGDEPAPATESSGVRGVVVSGPHCPVETVASPCPDVPVADIAVSVTTPEGDVAGEPRTNEAGRFELAVPAGDYLLQPVIEGGVGLFAKPQEVSVPAGAWVEATLQVDTGIR